MMKMMIASLALMLSASVLADDCFSPSPAALQGDIHALQHANPLTASQRSQVDSLLSSIAKRRREGESSGFFCKQTGEGSERVTESYDLVLRPQQLKKGDFDLRLVLSSRSRATSEERIRYTLGADKLYLGPNDRGNEVVILAQSKTELKTLERYRRRLASGGSMAREAVRHYKISGKTLTVENRYYSNGRMISENRWRF